MLTIWEATYRITQWRPDIYPSPSGVLDAFTRMLGTPTAFADPVHTGWPWREHDPFDHNFFYRTLHSQLLIANAVSLSRLVIGFIISVLVGAVLGAALWEWHRLDSFVGPLLLGLQTLPSVCWAPMAFIVFGYSESAILFVMTMGSTFAIAISMRDGLRGIPPLYKRAGLMLGARGWKLYRYVLLPATLPALASSLRQGFSFAWRSLMGGELVLLIDKHPGLGYRLEVGRTVSDIQTVVAVMAMMVIIGMTFDRLAFAKLEHAIHTRFGLIAAGEP